MQRSSNTVIFSCLMQFHETQNLSEYFKADYDSLFSFFQTNIIQHHSFIYFKVRICKILVKHSG